MFLSVFLGEEGMVERVIAQQAFATVRRCKFVTDETETRGEKLDRGWVVGFGMNEAVALNSGLADEWM